MHLFDTFSRQKSCDAELEGCDLPLATIRDSLTIGVIESEELRMDIFVVFGAQSR